MDKDINKNTADETTGFCGGCRSNCPLSAPNCPTGMIEKAMAERAVPIKRHS